MDALSPAHLMRSVDIRNVLNVAPSALFMLYKKLGIKHADTQNLPKQGTSKHVDGLEVRKILESKGFRYPEPARVITFMMCKGGVGKTTSSFFLAQRLSAYGAKVLVIDADSQGNLTSAFNLEELGVSIDSTTPIMVDVITGRVEIHKAIIPVTPNLHLIPSTPLNANLEGKIRENFKNPSLPFKKAIAPLLSQYEYILFDCAPALNLTNTAIICSSNTVVLPVSPDKFSLLGLEQTLNEIKQIESDFNFSVEQKISFTRYDAREFTSLNYLAEVTRDYGQLRFMTAIRTCADLKNAITKREDLFNYKKSNAKEDYDALTQEIMGLDHFFKNRKKLAESAAG